MEQAANNKTKPNRKEVYLTDIEVSLLQAKADRLGRSLKRHMELVLIEDAKKEEKRNSTKSTGVPES